LTAQSDNTPTGKKKLMFSSRVGTEEDPSDNKENIDKLLNNMKKMDDNISTPSLTSNLKGFGLRRSSKSP